MAINSTFYLDAADLASAASVYLDNALSNIAPDGFYSDGTIVREQSSGVLLTQTDCGTCGTLTLAYRNSVGASSYSETICDLEIDPSFYISTSTSPTISTGDIAFNTTTPLDYFNGGNKYYKAYIAIGTEYDVYICQIGSTGYITVLFNCPVVIP
jgi:hypothetical protein